MTPSSPPPPSTSAGRHEGEGKGEEKPKSGGLNKNQLVSLAFQLGFIIAIPVVIFGYLGKWLDGKTGTYPVLTLIGIFTAIVFTSLWIYRKFKGYFGK